MNEDNNIIKTKCRPTVNCLHYVTVEEPDLLGCCAVWFGNFEETYPP
jgi:hypothetical protein